MKAHSFHPHARAEYARAAGEYAQISPELGERFYQEMERLIADIRDRPGLFRVYDPPARRHFSADFPYGILYLNEPDRVWIVAVMHLHDEPGYWRERLP